MSLVHDVPLLGCGIPALCWVMAWYELCSISWREQKGGRCSDGGEGGGRGSGRHFSVAAECVSDRCERWASGGQAWESTGWRGRGVLLYGQWRPAELEAVSCFREGWREYQTAAAYLTQPNSHARLQTTLRAAALWVRVWVRVREKRKTICISRARR